MPVRGYVSFANFAKDFEENIKENEATVNATVIEETSVTKTKESKPGDGSTEKRTENLNDNPEKISKSKKRRIAKQKKLIESQNNNVDQSISNSEQSAETKRLTSPRSKQPKSPHTKVHNSKQKQSHHSKLSKTFGEAQQLYQQLTQHMKKQQDYPGSFSHKSLPTINLQQQKHQPSLSSPPKQSFDHLKRSKQQNTFAKQQASPQAPLKSSFDHLKRPQQQSSFNRLPKEQPSLLFPSKSSFDHLKQPPQQSSNLFNHQASDQGLLPTPLHSTIDQIQHQTSLLPHPIHSFEQPNQQILLPPTAQQPNQQILLSPTEQGLYSELSRYQYEQPRQQHALLPPPLPPMIPKLSDTISFTQNNPSFLTTATPNPSSLTTEKRATHSNETTVENKSSKVDFQLQNKGISTKLNDPKFYLFPKQPSIPNIKKNSIVEENNSDVEQLSSKAEKSAMSDTPMEFEKSSQPQESSTTIQDSQSIQPNAKKKSRKPFLYAAVNLALLVDHINNEVTSSQAEDTVEHINSRVTASQADDTVESMETYSEKVVRSDGNTAQKAIVEKPENNPLLGQWEEMPKQEPIPENVNNPFVDSTSLAHSESCNYSGDFSNYQVDYNNIWKTPHYDQSFHQSVLGTPRIQSILGTPSTHSVLGTPSAQSILGTPAPFSIFANPPKPSFSYATVKKVIPLAQPKGLQQGNKTSGKKKKRPRQTSHDSWKLKERPPINDDDVRKNYFFIDSKTLVILQKFVNDDRTKTMDDIYTLARSQARFQYYFTFKNFAFAKNNADEKPAFLRIGIPFHCNVCDEAFRKPEDRDEHFNSNKHEEMEILRQYYEKLTTEFFKAKTLPGYQISDEITKSMKEGVHIDTSKTEYKEKEIEETDMFGSCKDILKGVDASYTLEDFVLLACNKLMDEHWPKPQTEHFCRMCNFKSFDSEAELDNHNRSQRHKESGANFTNSWCAVCQFNNYTEDKMQLHVKSEHHLKFKEMFNKAKEKCAAYWNINHERALVEANQRKEKKKLEEKKARQEKQRLEKLVEQRSTVGSEPWNSQVQQINSDGNASRSFPENARYAYQETIYSYDNSQIPTTPVHNYHQHFSGQDSRMESYATPSSAVCYGNRMTSDAAYYDTQMTETSQGAMNWWNPYN